VWNWKERGDKVVIVVGGALELEGVGHGEKSRVKSYLF